MSVEILLWTFLSGMSGEFGNFVTVLEGQSLELHCPAIPRRAEPLGSLMWRKLDDEYLSFAVIAEYQVLKYHQYYRLKWSSEMFTLVLYNVTREEHNGPYDCAMRLFVTNTTINCIQKFYITVLTVPEKPLIESKERTGDQAASFRRFTCQSFGYPTPSMKFYKTGPHRSSEVATIQLGNKSMPTIASIDVILEGDYGDYGEELICSVDSPALKRVYLESSLKIKYTKTDYRSMTGALVVICIALLAVISWLQPTKDEEEDKKRVVIKRVHSIQPAASKFIQITPSQRKRRRKEFHKVVQALRIQNQRIKELECRTGKLGWSTETKGDGDAVSTSNSEFSTTESPFIGNRQEINPNLVVAWQPNSESIEEEDEKKFLELAQFSTTNDSSLDLNERPKLTRQENV